MIVSTHAGGHLIIWEPWFRFGAPKAGVEGIGLLVQVHPDGARALTVVQANDALRIASVQGYDTATPSVSHLFDAPLPRSFTGGAAVSPDLKRLASVAAGEGDTANAITVYDVEKRAAIRTLLAPQPRKVPPLDLPALAVLAFDRSGRYVIAGHDSGHALVWDLSREAAEAATTFELSQHSAVDFRFKFSSRGDLLLALSAHEIQVWRDWHAPHPVRVAQWKVEKDRSFVSASLSPDNSLLAIAVNDDGGEVRVWKNGQRSAWQLVRRLDTPRASDRAGRPEDVVDLAFHGSANVLAIMDRAGVSVFDMDKVDAQPVRLKRPRLPDLAEGRVGFSSDGKYIIAASTFPGDFVLWLWRPEDLIRDACASLVLEELSAAQWQEYIKVLPRAPACPGTRKAAAIARR